MNGGLAIAILAAGGARRFGGGKLDADLNGKPLGQWVLEAARATGPERLAVVVADPAPTFAREAACDLLLNRRAEEGLGTSAALAAEWANESGSEALLILLADMPLVSPATLRELAKAGLRGRTAAVAYPGGSPGVPACFPAAQFQAVERLTGEAGAAQVLRGMADLVLLEAAADELRDVDRPEDLIELTKLLG